MGGLRGQGDFEITRHGGAYKMIMSIHGQPNHGSKIRAVGGGTAGGAEKGESQSGRAQFAHALNTSRGATVSSYAALSESRDVPLDLVKGSSLASPWVTRTLTKSGCYIQKGIMTSTATTTGK